MARKGSLLAALFALCVGVSADYDGNINYRSPSLRHPRLGIDVDAVRDRSLHAKRDEVPFEPSQLNFTHGVASGDPYPDSVILWTRIAPSMKSDESDITVTGDVPLFNHETDPYIRATPHPICLDYKVFADEECSQVVDQGQAFTTSEIDYTVKVEAKNLQPFTAYYYRFNVCNSDNSSPLGRTKTSPAVGDATEEIKFAVHSCSNYPNGYFNAYGNVVRKDTVDFVLHLGDYIYEYKNGKIGKQERAHDPERELFTLHDYRTRYGQYRTDLDLYDSHKNFAWIPIWDDHEVANNVYKDGTSGQRNTGISFTAHGRKASVDQRKMNAVRAYFEWMPLRQVDMDDGLRVWRSFQMGSLLDLIMLDTRQYDRSITDLGENGGYIKSIMNDASRTLMGARQENWFYRSLSESWNRGATWRIIGDQLRFARLDRKNGKDISLDSWDGYRANQNRTLKHLYENEIGNNIMLAGDTHVNWVSDIAWIGKHPYDPVTGNGSVGVEFAGTAVTSIGVIGNRKAAEKEAESYAENEELHWNEAYYRGYYELHVRKDEVEARYFGCPTISHRNAWELPLANFTVKSGDNHLARPVGGGRVEAGYIQNGTVEKTNICMNTETGEWKHVEYDKMYISLANLIPL